MKKANLRIGILVVLLSGALLVQAAAIISEPSQSNELLTGSQVPELRVRSLQASAVIELGELVRSGCGHVYIFDIDCPVCQRSFGAIPDSAPPQRPAKGASFNYWLALDRDPTRVDSAMTSYGIEASILIPSLGSPSTNINSVPRVWRVQNGVITGIGIGRSETTRTAVESQEHLRC